LIANCDEFIYYDDLVREEETKKRKPRRAKTEAATQKQRNKTEEDRKQEALDLTIETIDALLAERGEEEKIWSSMVKQALKRRKPGFNESYYGYRSFSDLLKDAETRQLLKLERDERSGNYTIRTVTHGE
jgi:hypothetical protein